LTKNKGFNVLHWGLKSLAFRRSTLSDVAETPKPKMSDLFIGLELFALQRFMHLSLDKESRLQADKSFEDIDLKSMVVHFTEKG